VCADLLAAVVTGRKKILRPVVADLGVVNLACVCVCVCVFTDKCYHISSISEEAAKRLSKEECPDFVRHNLRQLSRIYPAGSRVASTNYDPMPMWLAGCQVGECSQDS
jgi:hypothetical protein